jgi:ankyrin repeat protein
MNHSLTLSRFACGTLALALCLPATAVPQAAAPAQTTPPAKTPPQQPARPSQNAPGLGARPDSQTSEPTEIGSGAPVKPAPGTRQALPAQGPLDTTPQVQPARPPAYTEQAVRIEPSPLDLGEMSPEVAKSGKVKITNITNHPITITRIQPSCGCTTTTAPPGAIEPGASTEIDITIKPPAQGGHPLSKTVTFMVQDHPPQVLTVQGVVKEYIAIAPSVLNGPSAPNPAPTPVRLTSKDQRPFSITGATPDVFTGLPKASALEHEVQVDWAKWESSGMPAKVAIMTDSPFAPQVSFLIKRAIKPDAAQPPRSGSVPPIVIAAREGSAAKVQEALKEGASIEASEPTSDRTALHFAAEAGNVEVVKALLAAKANPNAPDRTGRSPLTLAAEKKHGEVLKMLIAAGGNVELKDQLGGTPIVWAAGLGNTETVGILLNAGANPNVVDRQGMTPLIWAATIGRHETVEMLIQKGADVNAKDQLAGETALIRAVRTGELESVKALLKSGAKLDVRNNQGMTPLLVACYSGDLAKIKAILDAGADKTAKDQRGWGAIDFARNRVDPAKAEIVKFLEPIVPPSTAVAPPEGTPAPTGASASKGQ